MRVAMPCIVYLITWFLQKQFKVYGYTKVEGRLLANILSLQGKQLLFY